MSSSEPTVENNGTTSEPTSEPSGTTSEPTDGTKNLVILQSSDGERFEVEEAVAVKSETIKHMIADDCAYSEIPIHNVTGAILSKVIEYCKRHVDACSPAKTDDKPSSTAVSDEELNDFDADFVNVDQSTLFGLVNAANYLNIKPLVDLTLKAVADMIKDRTPEEVREILRVENDFTPEEEEQVRLDTQWAFGFDMDEEEVLPPIDFSDLDEE